MRNDVCERDEGADIVFPIARDGITRTLKTHVALKAQEGVKKAIADSKSNPEYLTKLSTKLLDDKIDKTVTEMLKDIKRKLKDADTRAEKEAAFNSVEYRLRFLSEQIVTKAYWFGYVKTCAQLNINQVYVNFGKSKDGESHEAIVNTKHFTLDDIPAYNAYCSCKIGLKKAGE